VPVVHCAFCALPSTVWHVLFAPNAPSGRYGNGDGNVGAFAGKYVGGCRHWYTNRSPVARPNVPPHLYPLRTREPVSTPAGMPSFTVSVFRGRPFALAKNTRTSAPRSRRRSGPTPWRKRKRVRRHVCTLTEPLQVAQTNTPDRPAKCRRAIAPRTMFKTMTGEVGIDSLDRPLKRQGSAFRCVPFFG